MEITILASGSKGNALVINNNNNLIVVDIGISYMSFKEKAIKESLDIKRINALLITHEHSDHIRGLKTFLKNHTTIEIYITKGTYDVLPKDIKELMNNKIFIDQDEDFTVNLVDITSFALSHDANQPVGYVFQKENKKVVLATDTGYIDESYFDLLAGANLYILESNHSPELLMNSGRPFYLKQRILGQKGHLSNEEASWLINHFTRDIEETIWAVAHISEDCNTIFEIEKTIVEIVEDPTKIEVIYTSQETSEVIKL